MKKTFYLLITALIGTSAANAQTFAWAKSFSGGSGTQMYAQSTCLDPTGDHVFSGGYFSGTYNFDPTGTNFTLTEANPSVFVTKHSADGTLAWARSFSCSDYAVGCNISTDATGNTYAFGSFAGTLDCDPGAGTHLLSASGGSEDMFLIKLDVSGDFVWAQKFGVAGTDYPGGISVKGNSIYCSGGFTGTCDFDNGAGTTSLVCADYMDIFVMELDTDGELQWAYNMGSDNNNSSATEWGIDLAADASGTVYVTGTFSAAGDFDPTTGVTTLTPQGTQDGFIIKLVNGNFQWAIRTGNSSMEYNARIAISQEGSVYQCGTYLEGANDNMYIGHYSGQGALLWEHRIGGNAMEQGIAIATDEDGSVYVTGDYASNNADFDPGTGQALLPNPNFDNNTYLLKLDLNGNFEWVTDFSGSNPNAAFGLEYADGAMYLAGYYFSSMDANPGTAVYNLNGGSASNTFLVKLDSVNVIDHTGIAEYEAASFGLYPNPATDATTLHMGQFMPGTSVTLYNLQGEIVLYRELHATDTELDLDALLSGTYLVEVQQNGIKSTLRMVKQ